MAWSASAGLRRATPPKLTTRARPPGRTARIAESRPVDNGGCQRANGEHEGMPRRQELPAAVRGRAIRVAEAATWGLTPSQLRAKSAQRPFRGIRGFGIALSTDADRCRAYLPELREHAAFSHATAALIYGLPLPERLRDQPIHVTSTAATRPRIPGVVGHRERNVRRRQIGDLPVVAPADVWCELARSLTLPELVAVGDALISGIRRGGRRAEPLCEIAELREAIDRRSPAAGTAKLREAFLYVRSGVDSPQETFLRMLVIGAGYEEPVVAPTAIGADGVIVTVDGFMVHPDLGYPKWRIAFEYEGDHHRTDQRQWRRDIARVRALEAAGWTVLRVTASDLIRPESLFSALRAALARHR